MGHLGGYPPKLAQAEKKGSIDPEITNLSRYLVFSAKGKSTGSYICPDWYTLMTAARYIGCTPWELLEQSVWWRDKAIVAMNAEASANKSLEGQ